ncbi:MAG: hypothetical protein KF802_12215 [Bdellovibrionaceae bacterium]|nr:hypothetical protein [Pseudobdellovibrionaceae bacterium]MBX3032882.1 hypothetical protein [Pseudobdellovibrionaceae bacterium]
MSVHSSPGLTLLYAFDGFEKDLEAELRLQNARIDEIRERLFIVHDLQKKPLWAQAYGPGARILRAESISTAARALKGLGKRWACASTTLHRRSELIQAQVQRPRPAKPLSFLGPLPKEPCGIWALIDADTLIASPQTDSPLPLGEAVFAEDPHPPSRAYLKLWELFTVQGVRPAAGERVIDLGSSPGGWTWVLAQMGCRVLSVDKAPLDPRVARLPGVEAVKKDAFKLQPAEVGAVDWLFSDLICYPDRLFELVRTWQDAGVKNFVCTIKFQGPTDFAAIEKFARFPGSQLVHLNANKHEVTWFLRPS